MKERSGNEAPKRKSQERGHIGQLFDGLSEDSTPIAAASVKESVLWIPVVWW